MRDTTRRPLAVRPTPWVVVLLCACALPVGCTLPLTTQTLTGGALNAGAMLFVDQYNDGDFEGRGAYRYDARANVDTLAAIFESAVAEANRAHAFQPAERATPPAETPPAVAASDGVVFARASEDRRARRDDPAARETFLRRQWTPSPLYDVHAGSPEARGDTLTWVVTHRSSRQVAFRLVPRRGGAATRVWFLPYDPPADVFLSVPADHAQRNAVESLHETFYFAVTERLGTNVFVDVQPQEKP